MDRKTLVQTLERNFQRHRTISILEGKEGPNRRQRQKAVDVVNASDSDDEEDIEATPGKSSHKKSNIAGNGKGGYKALPDGKIVDDSGRVSQFMDADEADAQEQVQQQLAAGAKLVSPNV